MTEIVFDNSPLGLGEGPNGSPLKQPVPVEKPSPQPDNPGFTIRMHTNDIRTQRQAQQAEQLQLERQEVEAALKMIDDSRAEINVAKAESTPPE